MRISQQFEANSGNVFADDKASPDGIVKVMVHVGDDVTNPNHPGFKRLRKRVAIRKDLLLAFGVPQDTVSHLSSEIQASPVSFKDIYDPQALCVMRKPVGENLIEHCLA
jgi:hypothetical protein